MDFQVFFHTLRFNKTLTNASWLSLQYQLRNGVLWCKKYQLCPKTHKMHIFFNFTPNKPLISLNRLVMQITQGSMDKLLSCVHFMLYNA